MINLDNAKTVCREQSTICGVESHARDVRYVILLAAHRVYLPQLNIVQNQLQITVIRHGELSFDFCQLLRINPSAAGRRQLLMKNCALVVEY